MRRLAPILALLLAGGCDAASEDRTQAGAAGSLLAEWGLVKEQQARLPAIYVREMQKEAQSQLESVASASASANGPASREIAALAAVPANPSSAALNARAARAQAIEDRLEAR